jgi:hypothetical protein
MKIPPDMELCRLCNTKKAKRYCPAVAGQICPTCCGAAREVTLDCPLDCEFLLEARLHERIPEVDPHDFPNSDIQVTERFLRDNEHLLVYSAQLLLATAASAKANDTDVREALDAMIRTQRTSQAGLIYETRPQNPFAASVQENFTKAIEEFAQKLHEETGAHLLRDNNLIGVLAFLERLAIQHNNSRPRGRAFLSFLREHFPVPAEAAASASRLSLS